jgi:anti-anti-sigma factor
LQDFARLQYGTLSALPLDGRTGRMCRNRPVFEDTMTATRSQSIEVVALEGRIDAFSARGHRHTILAALEGGSTRFVVDLSATTFMDSAGLGIIIGLVQRARELGGVVILVQPTGPAIVRQLHVTRVDRLLDIQPTRAAALQKVA